MKARVEVVRHRNRLSRVQAELRVVYKRKSRVKNDWVKLSSEFSERPTCADGKGGGQNVIRQRRSLENRERRLENFIVMADEILNSESQPTLRQMLRLLFEVVIAERWFS